MSFLLIDHKTNQCLWLWLCFLSFLPSSVAGRYDAVTVEARKKSFVFIISSEKPQGSETKAALSLQRIHVRGSKSEHGSGPLI